MQPLPPPQSLPRSRVAAAALASAAGTIAALLALALLFDTAAAIWMFGFSELHADQFRQYRTLLENGFPKGLLVPDNAHRQIVSNLVRWLDIDAFHGSQAAGIAAGLAAWATACGILGVQLWRATRGMPLQRGAALLGGATALGWMGAARVQLHGNEAPQVYFVVCLALLAAACVADRERAGAWRWGAALSCGLLGMLTFGSGVAILGGVLGLAVVLRHPPLRIAAATAVAVAGVLAYTFLLPGGDGVRGSVALDPRVVLGNAATWLGSAWTTGWLAWGGEGAFGAGPERMLADGRWGSALVASAGALRALLGDATTLALAQLCGASGLVLLAVFALRAWWRPQQGVPLQRIGLGLALFGSALAVLVAIGRSRYFVEYPHQLLADRYVMWTALFWLGLGLCALGALPTRSPLAGWLGLLLAGLVMGMALPSHRIGAIWGAAAARAMEARAAQAQANVLMPGWPDHADLPDLDAVAASLQFYRARQQAMFRTPRSRLLGTQLRPDTVAAADRGPVLDWYPHEAGRVDADKGGEGEAWHVAGHLFATRQPGEGLLALDRDRRVVGLGEFSYDHPGPPWQRLDRAARGFDLYLRTAPTACPEVVLYRSDATASRLERLAPLACARAPTVAATGAE